MCMYVYMYMYMCMYMDNWASMKPYPSDVHASASKSRPVTGFSSRNTSTRLPNVFRLFSCKDPSPSVLIRSTLVQ